MEIQTKRNWTAGQKRTLRLILDTVMLILLVLMYKKQVISLSFHEIGGLALYGLFLIHLIGNAGWIAAATKRLFAKATPALVRARYIVDALLLIAFLAIVVTGILISRVVFSFHIQGNFQSLHYFFSALAVVLMGVHLGLHADYIFCRLFRCGANKIVKIALAAVIAAMIAFGGYSLFNTSFLRYLAAPIQTAQFSRGTFQPSGDIALDGSNDRLPSDLSQLPEFSGNDAQPHQGGGNGGFGDGQGQGRGDGFGGLEGREGGSGGAALLIAQYVSITAFFSAATYGVIKLTTKRKRKPKEESVVIESNE